MKYILQQIVSFILPVTVLIVVPFCIESDLRVKPLTPYLIAGIVVMCPGLLMMALTITAFIRRGKGTLAPWSPTKKLLVEGLYAYTRNPMITGVLIVLTGEALAFLSLHIAIWAVIFFGVNTLYFIVYEEPDLERKFGGAYRSYKKHVPRWLPNIRPYLPSS